MSGFMNPEPRNNPLTLVDHCTDPQLTFLRQRWAGFPYTALRFGMAQWEGTGQP